MGFTDEVRSQVRRFEAGIFPDRQGSSWLRIFEFFRLLQRRSTCTLPNTGREGRNQVQLDQVALLQRMTTDCHRANCLISTQGTTHNWACQWSYLVNKGPLLLTYMISCACFFVTTYDNLLFKCMTTDCHRANFLISTQGTTLNWACVSEFT